MTTAALRYVPTSSPVHRMWAGTKLLAVTALAVTVVAEPTWPVEAGIATVYAGATAAARLPRGWLPRPPRWLALLLVAPVAIAALGGWSNAAIALRATAVGLLFVYGSLLLAATTRSADVPPAIAVLLRPARAVRLPVDDLVAVTGLSVRCLPLLLDDMTTLLTVWRLRLPPAARRGRAGYVRLVGTAVAVVVRRAREMAETVHARGGPGGPPPQPWQLGAADAVAALLVLGCAALAAASAFA